MITAWKALSMKTLSNGVNFFKKHWYFIIIVFILAVGIVSRFEAYLLNRQLYADEASLVCNFFEHMGFLWVFESLNHWQLAPPLFLIIIKILTICFGTSEYVFRLFPFVASICSVPAFYFLSKRILKSKHSVLLANFLFCTHFVLLQYSVEIKQYSTDILLSMLVLLWLPAIKTDNLDKWQIARYSIIFTLLCFLSQPVMFLLFGFILYNLLQNFRNFKICTIAVMPLVCMLVYKFSMPIELRNFMNHHWNCIEYGFLSFKSFKNILIGNYWFFQKNANYMVILYPFALAGLFVIGVKKSKINRILLLSIFGALLASALKLYPVANRTALYLFPYIFIFIASCFDFEFFNKKINKVFSATIVFTVVFAAIFFQLKVFSKNRLFYLENISQSRKMISTLQANYKVNEKIIMEPGFKSTLFYYYSNRLNFYPETKNIIIMDIYGDNLNFNQINSLSSNEFYWVLAQNKTEVNKNLQSWIDKQEIFYKIRFGFDDYIYKIRPAKQELPNI